MERKIGQVGLARNKKQEKSFKAYLTLEETTKKLKVSESLNSDEKGSFDGWNGQFPYMQYGYSGLWRH